MNSALAYEIHAFHHGEVCQSFSRSTAADLLIYVAATLLIASSAP
jgi:hypothetical protein